MAKYERLRSRRREDYCFVLDYRTRWSDNDQYAHMNNTIYIQLFDAVVNTYLIRHCGLQPTNGDQYGMVVHSHTDYFASLSFPAIAELAMRVNKLGKSSVTYEIAVFEKGHENVRAVGEFVQVLVDRSTGRPNPKGMNDTMRRGLERINLKGSDGSKL